jgi:CheY-like chemotaxis protein
MIKEVKKRLGGASEEEGDEADQCRPKICRVPDPRLTADDSRSPSAFGYDVVMCQNGTEACDTLREDCGPRLAVVDWVMPGLDGPEVCQKVRIGTNLGFIYVILLTGKNEKSTIGEGLEAGAHEFVSKPFDADVLRSRLKVGERILFYETRIDERNALLGKYAREMEALAEERVVQLVHADQMVTLGTMTVGIALEINNPNSFVSGNIQMLEKSWPDVESALRASLDSQGCRRQ